MKAPHRIAGRLRLRFSALQNCHDLAHRLESAVRRLDGVCLVQTNIHTGTLLIHYTACGPRETALLADIDALTRTLMLVSSAAPQHAQPQPALRSKRHLDRQAHRQACRRSDRSQRVVSFLVGLAVEKCLDHAGLRLLRLVEGVPVVINAWCAGRLVA